MGKEKGKEKEKDKERRGKGRGGRMDRLTDTMPLSTNARLLGTTTFTSSTVGAEDVNNIK